MNRRSTKQRQAIQSVLEDTRVHLTGDELLLCVKEVIPTVNAATLYRNLNVLEEERVVSRVSVGGKTFFEHAVDQHSHFYCHVCERLIAVDADALPTPSQETLRTTSGFVAERVSLLVEGTCAACSTEHTEMAASGCASCPSLCSNVISEAETEEIACKIEA